MSNRKPIIQIQSIPKNYEGFEWLKDRFINQGKYKLIHCDVFGNDWDIKEVKK